MGRVCIALCAGLLGCAPDEREASLAVAPSGLSVRPIALPMQGAWSRAAGVHEADLGAARVEVSGDGLTLRVAGASARFKAHRSGHPVVEQVDQSTMRLADGDATEELRLGPDGYEQSWHYADRVGHVAQTVDIEGLALDHADAEGLHLRGAGGLRVRYGHGTWIDAEGRRTHVPAVWRAGHIVLDVPDAVVAASRFPAVLDPEVAVEGQPTLTTIAPTTFPTLTPGPSGSLLWWVRTISGSSFFAEGQRIDATGRVIDRAVFRMPTSGQAMRVAPVGAGWLLFSGGTGSSVFALPGTGDPLAVSPPSLENGADITVQDSVEDVACGETSCMVVGTWANGSPMPDTGGLAGSIRDLRGVAPRSLARSRLRFSISPVAAPRVAPAGDGFLVAWTDMMFGLGARDVRVVKVRSDGTLTEPEGRGVSAWGFDRTTGCFASNGTSAVLVWSAARSSGTRLAGVYASQIANDGALMGNPTFLGPGGAERCTLHWTGSQYVLARAGRMRLDATGAPLGAVGASEPAQGSATGSATISLVVDNPTGDVNIYSAANARVGAVAGLYRYIQDQRSPALFHDGTDLLVTWSADLSRSGEAYRALRVARGVPTSPASTVVPLSLANNSGIFGVQSLQGGFNGTDYLLLNSPYNSTTMYYGGAAVSVSRSGSTTRPASSANVLISDRAPYRFDRVRNTATGYIVAQRCRSLWWIGPGYDITTRSPYLASNGPIDGCAASMDTLDGTTYFVFINRASSTAPGVFGIRFDANGDPLDGAPRRLSTDLSLTSVSLHAGGGRLLVGLGNSSTARLVEMMPDWSVVREIPFPQARWTERVFDGRQHVLVGVESVVVSSSSRIYITARRMSARGDLLDPAPIRVIEVTGNPSPSADSLGISVASVGDGVTYVGYQKNDPLVSRSRIYVVAITDATLDADAGTDAGVIDATVMDVGNDAPFAVDVVARPDVPTFDASAADTPSPAADITTVDVARADSGVRADTAATDVGVAPHDRAEASTDAVLGVDAAASGDRPQAAEVAGEDVPTASDGGSLDVNSGVSAPRPASCSCRVGHPDTSPRARWCLVGLAVLPMRRRRRRVLR